MGFAYKVTSPSGKSYVGITMSSVEARWKLHVREACKRKGRWALHRAIRKYGHEAFVVETLAELPTWSELCLIERELIASHGTHSPSGYNMTIGGDGVVGLCPEAKAAHKANTSSGTRRAWQNPAMRQKRADAWNVAGAREKHSLATSEGTRAAYSNPDVRKRLAEARASQDYRERVRASMKARWLDPKYRASQVEKRNRRGPRTEESKRRQGDLMRASIAARRARGVYLPDLVSAASRDGHGWYDL